MFRGGSFFLICRYFHTLAGRFDHSHLLTPVWRDLLLRSILLLLFAPLPTSVLSTVYAQELQRYEFSSPQMGTQFRIVLYAGSDSLANMASRAAFDRVTELNDSLSDYLPDSELSRLSRSSGSGTFVPVSDDLYQVLEKSVEISRLSDGAFDVTAGPYTQLWRAMRKNPETGLPDFDELARAGSGVGYQLITFNRDARSVRLERPDMRLDPGGIAKGYAGDEVLKVLYSYGITSAMVDAGGDLVLGDAPPGEEGWRIMLPLLSTDQPRVSSLPDSPQSPDVFPTSAATQISRQIVNSRETISELTLSNCAVATSGDLYQYVEIDGKRYSHIIDPKTGLGLTENRRVTVIAPDGITADGLSSAISVLDTATGIRLLEQLDKIEGVVIHQTDDNMLSTYSSGFQRLMGEAIQLEPNAD